MRISDWISDVCSSDLKFWIFISRSANAFERPSFRYSNRSGDYGADAALGEGLAALKRPAGDLGGVGYPSRIFFRTPSEPVWERQFFVAAMPSVDCVVDLLRRRSEERRVGKAGVSTCRSRWSPSN